MPTARPRHLVTETDVLAAALDDAAARWPGLSRPQLLVRLALQGAEAATVERDERRRRRLQLLRQHSGVASGVFGVDYLERLRDDWPE